MPVRPRVPAKPAVVEPPAPGAAELEAGVGNGAVGDGGGSGGVLLRPLGAGDSFAALTELLHRAYAKQIARGLCPLAGRQDEATTRRRCSSGETTLAVLAMRPVGALPDGGGHEEGGGPLGMILYGEVEDAEPPPHFRRADVGHFSLFAVDPGYQHRGIGSRLLAAVEARAVELGMAELALSMAEPDEELMRYYLRRGFRFVEHWQWPYTNYRSAILSRPLRAGL